MKRIDLTEKIFDIKRERALSWADITTAIGGSSPILITAALLGQMRLTKGQAAKAAAFLGLTQNEERMLTEVPYRGSLPTNPPTDPLIYRFHEMISVYGTTLKELIQEEFGDGIASAIDFEMEIERQPHPKGDRVKIIMSGKFLPYKYYGNDETVPDYGFGAP